MQTWSRKEQDLEHIASNVLKLQRQKIVRSELQQKKAFGRCHFESGFCLNGIKNAAVEPPRFWSQIAVIFLPKSIA